MIEIKQWIKPDITKVLPNDNEYSSDKYLKYSVLIDQEIMVIQACHEDGTLRGTFRDGGQYYGLRLNKDLIEVCIPKFGWIQGGYDQFYGASAGTGFNLNQRLSFGYNFEKSLSNSIANLGVTHEISIAYSFVPNLSKNTFVSNEEEDSFD